MLEYPQEVLDINVAVKYIQTYLFTSLYNEAGTDLYLLPLFLPAARDKISELHTKSEILTNCTSNPPIPCPNNQFHNW